jgi:hypothetical protein
MDEELFNIQLHKFLSQHQYLTNLLCETKYLFNKYNEKFLCDYYEPHEIENHIKKQKDREHTDQEQNEHVDPERKESEEERDESCIGDVIAKLYRKLSLKTHPDKVPDQIETFKKVSLAYKKKDLLTMILIAFELHIDISKMLLSEYTSVIKLLEDNIQDIEKTIYDLKNTVAWHWAHATDDEKQGFKSQTKK